MELIIQKVVPILPLKVGKSDKLCNKLCCALLGQPPRTNVLGVFTLDGLVFAHNASFYKVAPSQAIVGLYKDPTQQIV